MHFCKAVIALQNDDQQQVHRDEWAPISWPEIDVIQQIHGEGAVRAVVPFVQVEQTARDEVQRLSLLYGEVIVSKGDPQTSPVYPGRNPNMIMEAPDYTLKPGTIWQNPLTGEVEVIQEDGSSEPRPRGPIGPPAPEAAAVAAREVVGDPRGGDPDTGATVSRRASSGRFQRAEKYSDEAGFGN